MITGKLLYAILMAIIIFMGSQFLLVYRDMMRIDYERGEMVEKLVEKDRLIADSKIELMNRDRDLHRMMRRLNELERKTGNVQWQKRTNIGSVQVS
jgi:hypothetical protein